MSCLFVYIYVCLSVCLFVILPLCLSEYRYISVCLFLCLFVCVSACMYVCLCVCLFSKIELYPCLGWPGKWRLRICHQDQNISTAAKTAKKEPGNGCSRSSRKKTISFNYSNKFWKQVRITYVSSVASKLFNIHWIRTGSEPFWIWYPLDKPRFEPLRHDEQACCE